MPSKLNAAWHENHPMPKNATLEQRVRWHEQHAKHCTCREMPPKIREILEGRSVGGREALAKLKK